MADLLGKPRTLLGGSSLFVGGNVGGGIRDVDEKFVASFASQKTKGGGKPTKDGGGGDTGGGGGKGGNTKEPKPPKGGRK